MHIFTYNGKRSSSFQTVISGNGTWNKPQPVYERISVPGRNGEIITFSGNYENVTVEYKCGMTRNADKNYAALVNFLMANPGYHRLEDSYHPEYFRLAMVESIGTPTFSRFYRALEFTVTFTCKPQTFLKSGERTLTFPVSSIQNYPHYETITNKTQHAAKPLLRVYGTGSFAIGGSTIDITEADGYTDFDCESENAYKDSAATNCNGNIRLSGDSFPVIPAGQSQVKFESGITRIEITPRWWQL